MSETYNKICPGCNSRYVKGPVGSWIDVELCAECEKKNKEAKGDKKVLH